MAKTAFNKEIVRSITRSMGRFAAILIISLLGAGFYAGLRMAAPDMRIDGDAYFDGTGLYDLCVMTSLGVDEGTLQLLREVEGVDAAMPAYRVDAMVSAGEGSYAACIESLPMEAARASDTSDGVSSASDDDSFLNRPILMEGRWPGDADECVVGVDAAHELGIQVGSSIAVQEHPEDGASEQLAFDEFTVTGLVNSPTYACADMLGTTQIGTGDVELYAYVCEEAFADDAAFAAAYLTVSGAAALQWDSAPYDEAVACVKQRVQDLSGELAAQRRQAVKDDLHYQLGGVFQEMSADLGWADDIELPDVYVLDRTKNAGVASLASDADGIDQIALFLPYMFFLVAILVSLTSMTRMVEEERLDIGTHKALGYGKARITSKYLIYGALASGVGSVIGVVVLGKLLPWFIVVSYGTTYAIPVYATPLDAGIALRAVGLALGITLAATWWAAASSLRERPAALMLPRVPKAGKRIVLERIVPLWRRLSFSQKVTARNLLRYKRRFFMAVLGVAGCTALLMVGFGLRDAIGGIVSMQYEQLVGYDVAVRQDDGINPVQREQVRELLADDEVLAYLEVADTTMLAQGPGEDVRIEIVVPSDKGQLANFVTLRDRRSGQSLGLGKDGIVLTEKAADVLGVAAGDTLMLFDEDDVGDKTGSGYEVVVASVAENYLGHYGFLSADAYRSCFGEEPGCQMVYARFGDEVQRPVQDAWADRVRALPGVNTVSFVADKIATYENMLGVMNKLIVIIVALSAALAFVVLYNLTNINITERVREIATIKVLGFTRREVNAYIFREVFAMSLIGAAIGCVLGVPLTFYIARAAETANMMFGRNIEPASFALSFALTLAFTVIVMFTMYPKLAHVDMVESLKSIE